MRHIIFTHVLYMKIQFQGQSQLRGNLGIWGWEIGTGGAARCVPLTRGADSINKWMTGKMSIISAILPETCFFSKMGVITAPALRIKTNKWMTGSSTVSGT